MISHRFKTIFVHIPKTGGQSVETVFLDAEGLTWKTRDTLVMRFNADPSRGPERLAHLTAAEYPALGYVTPAQFSEYFKFAVVRDPYARVLSEYRYRHPRGRVTLDAFLARSLEGTYTDMARHMMTQASYVTDATGRIIVDAVVRHEEFETGLAAVWDRVFGAPKVLPQRNVSVPGPRKAADLTAEQRRRIETLHAADFDLFGYPRWSE